MMPAPPRRRAIRNDVANKRRALAVLLPIQDRIGPWQTRAARLMGYARKLRTTGGYEPTLVAEAEALISAVSMQQRQLAETTGQLPPEVATNSRVLDTMRALQSVAANLETTLDLMQRRPS